MTIHKYVYVPESSTSEQQVNIAVIGSGYVGLVAAACFAEIGHTVICVDSDAQKIEALQQGHTPIHEQLLPELLQSHKEGRLTFTTSLGDAVRASQVVFIAVGTPPLENGDADLSYVEQVAVEIGEAINGYKVVVDKSTVPVYTSDWIERVMLRGGVPRELFDIVSNPEFLREGTAVTDFLHPDRIVIGTESDRAYSILSRIYLPLTDGSYYQKAVSIPGCCNYTSPAPILRTSAKSAELIKHASNAFLAMKISFINSVANLCDAVEADVSEVAQGMGMDRRIGGRFLSAGLGYGGSCFPKDIKAFRAIGIQVGTDLTLLQEVEHINEMQQANFLQKVRSTLWTLRGKKLAVLGLAFKGGTDDIRESPAINLIRCFLAEGCTIVAHDPAAMANACKVLPSANLTMTNDPYQAMDGADALVILTDWPQFAQLNKDEMKRRLAYPVVLDGRNLFDCRDMYERGFTYVSVGRPIHEVLVEAESVTKTA